MSLSRPVLATLITLALVTGASAADLPLRDTFPAFTPVPAFTWTGFYLGANAGYASNHNRLDGSVPSLGSILPGIDTVALRASGDGVTAGGQLGYNAQFGAGGGLVLGVEADVAYTGIERTTAVALPAALGLQASYRTRLEELGTVRGRLGYAFGPLLVYGTGGFAYGEATRQVDISSGGAGLARILVDDLDVGYAVGGGVEYALPTGLVFAAAPGAVTLRGEYLHYDLGQHSTPLSVAGQDTTVRMRNEGDIGRAAINYKF